jgi:pimeloyl-ACP methyl ester carboxylesterase
VLVHGWAITRREFDGQAELLAPHYTVLRYDRRGYGESSGRPDITADPADLNALLDALGYSRVRLLGHSQGAEVVLTFAVRYPERVKALILFGAGPPNGFGLPFDGEDALPFAEWARIARAHGADSLKSAIAVIAAQQFEGRADVEQRARAELKSYTALDFIDPAPPSNLVEPVRIDELRKVRAPTLVLIGANEMPYFQIVADALTYGISGARKAVIPGGGHAVNWIQPKRFVAEILAFLREAERSPGASR